jgi:hypothetical protein
MPSAVAVGALIGTCFAFAWAIAGAQGLGSQWRGLAVAIAATVSVSIGATVMWRSRSVDAVATSGSFNGAVYGWAVTLESLAIVITVIALRRRGRSEYIMPSVAFIVGAHFFGLARAMISGGRAFIWVGGIMCVLAAAIIFGLRHSLISSVQSMALTGFGCASILWISALWTMI